MARRRVFRVLGSAPAAVALIGMCAACAGQGPSAPGDEPLLRGVPTGAQGFLTPAQAEDVRLAAARAPSRGDQQLVQILTWQIAAFEPELSFVYDSADDTPNVYAYSSNGKKVLQLTGGLVRLNGMSSEGLFMALGHGAGVFNAEPRAPEGHGAVAAADYYAFAVLANAAWLLDSRVTSARSAYQQWTRLFAQVRPENAAGDTAQPLINPSLSCRLQAAQAGMSAAPLPTCGGGPAGG